jgi:hypothetical protein
MFTVDKISRYGNVNGVNIVWLLSTYGYFDPVIGIPLTGNLITSSIGNIVPPIAILLSQRTNRHIIKELNSVYSYVASFGVFGTPKSDNTGFNNPIGIAVDDSNNIYVCDNKNSRIVKLDINFQYVAHLNVIALGKPYRILFDVESESLYMVGVYKELYISVAKIGIADFLIQKSNKKVCRIFDKPFAICKSFNTGEFIVSLGSKLIKVIEEASTFAYVDQSITGISDVTVTGLVKHTNGDIYIAQNNLHSGKISRINSSYVEIGSTNRVSKFIICLSESPLGGSLYTYTCNKKIVRYSEDLNFIEDAYVQLGETIEFDKYDISEITLAKIQSFPDIFDERLDSSSYVDSFDERSVNIDYLIEQ